MSHPLKEFGLWSDWTVPIPCVGGQVIILWTHSILYPGNLIENRPCLAGMLSRLGLPHRGCFLQLIVKALRSRNCICLQLNLAVKSILVISFKHTYLYFRKKKFKFLLESPYPSSNTQKHQRFVMKKWILRNGTSPHWCGSVDWVPACETKGHRFDSQSGHKPRLWARSPVGGAWTNHTLMVPSLSPSLPLSLKSK